VHFAEQRARRTDALVNTKRYTVDNNVRATHNLLVAPVAAEATPRSPTSAPWGSTVRLDRQRADS
jgi:hypothetical protein